MLGMSSVYISGAALLSVAGLDALGGFKLTKHRHAPACSAAETSLPQPEHGLRTHHRLASE